jgi:hypothetical protein
VWAVTSSLIHDPLLLLFWAPHPHQMVAILLFAATLSQPCNQRTSCSTCASAPDSGSRPCFWCFDAAVTVGASACMEVGNNFTAGLLGGCQNVTFAQGDCACEPEQRNTCGECTTDWNCVWSTATLSIAVSTPNNAPGTGDVFTVGTGAACRVGTGFGGPDILENAYAVSGPLGGIYYVAWVLAPATWYWSQCNISGEAPAFYYTCSMLLSILCCCCCVYFVCSMRHRRRAVFGGTASAPYYVYREWQPVAVAQQGAVRVPVGVPLPRRLDNDF